MNKIKTIFEKICNEKGVRRIVTVISGAAIAIISTLFMLFIDTKIKIQVSFLFGFAVFGLAGGIMQVIGATNLSDEENKTSWLLLAISAFMGVGLLMSFGAATSDSTYVNFVTSNGNAKSDITLIKIFEYLTLIFGIINAIICFVSAILTTREHFVYIHKNGSEKVKKAISIVKISSSIFALVLVVIAIGLIANFPLVNGVTSFKFDQDGYKFLNTISYAFGGLSLFFGGESIVVTANLLEERLNKLEPVIEYSTYEITNPVNIIAIISIVGVLVFSIVSLCFVLIKKTEKNLYLRLLFGILVLVCGLLSLTFAPALFNSLMGVVDANTVFSTGPGIVSFNILTIVAGIIFTVLPIIEVEKKALKTID